MTDLPAIAITRKIVSGSTKAVGSDWVTITTSIIGVESFF